ncbi:MAG TPA: tRNA pseudouridine(38-40) synthase TruA [Armatimonadota bacterium]|nr:tRNA pseudouridine(38-40) synthase TruA [Armatimonadota bacterium]
MRNIALTIAYDGTDWYGFQRQRAFPTVQQELETALSKVFQHPVEIVCAGRTDTGVHAVGQVISFHTDNPIPIERVTWVTNRFLPDTIRIRSAKEKPAAFHARFSASYRRYWYFIQTRSRPDPIVGRFCWQIKSRLDIPVMARALRSIQGKYDFSAFCHQGEPNGSPIRTIHRAQVKRWRHGVIIDVQADAFLHQMIRLMVANTILIGTWERPESWLEELVRSRNRHLAGKGAPPCGLFLMRIGYPPTVNPRWGSVLEKLNNEELLG